MAISNTAFIRTSAVLLLVGFAALLLVVGLTFWLAGRTANYSSEVSSGRKIRSALVESRSLLQDAETGQRGFLLTQSEPYLAPYERARTRLVTSTSQFEDLLNSVDLARLKAVINEKLAELASTIALAKADRVADAIVVVKGDRGKDLMDEARGLYDRLLGEVDERIGRRMDDQDHAIVALRWAVILGSVLIVIVATSSSWLAFRYTRELMAARAELSSLNAGLETRVAERTAAVERANDEIQRFAYVVSHDLRSPLVNVIGFTSELNTIGKQLFGEPDAPIPGASSELGADFREALGFISSSVRRMDGLISAILRIAREGGRRLRPERVELIDVVDRAAESIAHRMIERHGEIVVSRPMPAITTDHIALEQIVSNLLDNAVKYADPARPPHIAVAAVRRADTVTLTVTDNGRGIAPADQERVFELFRRAGPQRDVPGEGIGLAHVKTLVRRLGGEIRLTSNPGKGSTFFVSLPHILTAEEARVAEVGKLTTAPA